MPRYDPIPELKRAIGAELARLVQGWNPDDVAYMLGTDRSRIAELRREKLDRFSLETLIRFLTRLGHHVELRWERRRIDQRKERVGKRSPSVHSASRGNAAGSIGSIAWSREGH